VSNTPVREGLLALRSEGFVRLVPRRGFIVAPLTRRDIRDLFWPQAQLGGELAARATQNMTPERLRILETNMVRYDRAVASDDRQAIGEFGHQFIARSISQPTPTGSHCYKAQSSSTYPPRVPSPAQAKPTVQAGKVR
jgi:DNA-binding GntR family transcriptional regulator